MKNSPIRNQIINAYRQLKNYYDRLPRDPDLDAYINQFSFGEVIEKIYAVGPYCWFLSDMREAKFLKIGGALEQMTGYTHEELVNKSFINAARFTNEQHLEGIVQAAGYFWGYYYAQPLENRLHIKSSYTYEFRRKDGSTFHALQQSSTIFTDKQGNGVYQFDLITDITHLDPIIQLRFFILDTSDATQMKNIPVLPGVTRNPEKLPVTPAEKRVLELMAQGKSIKMIAAQLNISENTVKHHRTNMFHKCQVSNMAELTAKAISQGWFLK
ncbi:LuxR C-terminal-related transcriptional regulator [Runella sp.]|uniref:LuxR C-terminal-related transcriptional regulator n=1 Tax=Runella sp. TaxID=1960881 RepID=UPI003D0EDDD2